MDATHLSRCLNERHYGALQGLGKEKDAERYGEEQSHRWKRDDRARQPPSAPAPRYPRHDVRYAHLASGEAAPHREPRGRLGATLALLVRYSSLGDPNWSLVRVALSV